MVGPEESSEGQDDGEDDRAEGAKDVVHKEPLRVLDLRTNTCTWVNKISEFTGRTETENKV